MDEQTKIRVRKELEAQYDDVMDTNEATEKFTFNGFMAPYAVVTEKSTGIKGCLAFTHMPRFYFDFSPI